MDMGLKGIATLLTERAAHRAAAAGRRVMFMLLGGICFLVTIGFLAAALYTWLDQSYGVYLAIFGLAAVFFVVGLILMLAGSMSGRRKPHPSASSADPLAGLAGLATEPVAPFAALVGAFALGFARGLRRRRQ
jgi:Na+/melibiose symporter-like transporter